MLKINIVQKKRSPHGLRGLRDMRSILVFWASQAISMLGTAMTNYALMIWVYGQKGTASSITTLSFFTFLPSVLFAFIAGAAADRWDKKKIILLCDCLAALGTLTILLLYVTSSLEIWHLYIINFTLSFMNAFQNPAIYVSVSLLSPKEHYVRVGGMLSLSNSLVSILAPALATAVLAFAGIEAVFIIDLLSFAAAFLLLLLFIKIPKLQQAGAVKERLLKSCLTGIKYLKEHSALLKLILFFGFVNLLSYMTGFGTFPAMILARSGNHEVALGAVNSALGFGALAGSVLVTFTKPANSKTKVIFLACAISFLLCDICWSFERSTVLWAASSFLGNLPIPFISANLIAVMRMNVPVELQGRVFAARDTLQFLPIPAGLFLGGFLADHVFEPFMMTASPLQQLLTGFFGSGKGSGMAVMFLLMGIVGCVSNLLCLKNPAFKELD
jgi:DHA3 family macrolide efflux protein-like MFS transporter